MVCVLYLPRGLKIAERRPGYQIKSRSYKGGRGGSGRGTSIDFQGWGEKTIISFKPARRSSPFPVQMRRIGDGFKTF